MTCGTQLAGNLITTTARISATSRREKAVPGIRRTGMPWAVFQRDCKKLPGVYDAGVSIQEIKTEIEALPADERKRLAAFLVVLRHKELAEYRTRMGRMIDDRKPENWATLEDLDQRFES